MPGATRIISTRILRPAVSLASERGVDAVPILERHRIGQRDLDLDDVYHPARAVLRAWCDLAEASGDPAFGLRAAQHVDRDTLEILGGILRLSNDACELAERLSRFQRLIGDVWAMHFDADAGFVRLHRAALVPAGEEHHLVERAAAIVVLELRRLGGIEIDPVSVSFRHHAPADLGMHAAIFRAPIEFDARENTVLYETAAMRRPIRYGSTEVARALEKNVRTALAAMPAREDWIDRVRRSIADLLPDGNPTLHTVSRRLHASERTVQRYLASRRTSVRRTVDEVRRALADEYLVTSALNMDEIAFLTGFRDPGAFVREFRRWHRQTPGEMRATRRSPASMPAP